MDEPALEITKQQAKQAIRTVAPWIEQIGRFGFAAKGIVYASVGMLIARSAYYYRQRPADAQDALRSLESKPYGEVLLVIMAAGLFGYSIWRITEAVTDPENKGTGVRGLIQRGAFVVSAVIYGGLGYGALRVAAGYHTEVGRGRERFWAAQMLDWPLGEWLVGLLGLIMIGVGVAHFYTSFTAGFCRSLSYYNISKTEKHWTIRIGRFGFAARAVVFCLIGFFLLKAAVLHDPNQAGGLREALRELGRQPYGLAILLCAGLGLTAYAFHMFVEARCKRFPLDNRG
jgi:hypothetical protein